MLPVPWIWCWLFPSVCVRARNCELVRILFDCTVHTVQWSNILYRICFSFSLFNFDLARFWKPFTTCKQHRFLEVWYEIQIDIYSTYNMCVCAFVYGKTYLLGIFDEDEQHREIERERERKSRKCDIWLFMWGCKRTNASRKWRRKRALFMVFHLYRYRICVCLYARVSSMSEWVSQQMCMRMRFWYYFIVATVLLLLAVWCMEKCTFIDAYCFPSIACACPNITSI